MRAASGSRRRRRGRGSAGRRSCLRKRPAANSQYLHSLYLRYVSSDLFGLWRVPHVTRAHCVVALQHSPDDRPLEYSSTRVLVHRSQTPTGFSTELRWRVWPWQTGCCAARAGSGPWSAEAGLQSPQYLFQRPEDDVGPLISRGGRTVFFPDYSRSHAYTLERAASHTQSCVLQHPKRPNTHSILLRRGESLPVSGLGGRLGGSGIRSFSATGLPQRERERARSRRFDLERSLATLPSFLSTHLDTPRWRV